MIFHTRAILSSSAPNKDHAVLLDIVTYSHNHLAFILILYISLKTCWERREGRGEYIPSPGI